LYRGGRKGRDLWLGGLGRGNVMDFLLEPLQCLADSFSYLRQFSRTENNEDDDENDDQF
jgi:hypothetical protein